MTQHSSIGFHAELKDKYDHEKNMLQYVTVEDIRKFGMIPEFIGRLPIISVSYTHLIGEMTLHDIIEELEKPGRDPRSEMPKPVLRTDVLEMKDLKEGMVLKGTVRNVIDRCV